jgi:hypothetical protein
VNDPLLVISWEEKMKETDKTTSSGVDVTFPFSVTDFAKGAREIIAAMDDLRKLASNLGNLVDRHKARAAAKDLAGLSFERGGMREPLARIAAGNWSDSDLDSLEQQLVATAEDAEKSIHGLSKYKSRLREKFGLGAPEKLDEIIKKSLDSYSKPWLRDALETLVRNARIIPDPEQVKANREYREWAEKHRAWLQTTAQNLAQKIDQLNERLIEMHDIVLPPTRPGPSHQKPSTQAETSSTKPKPTRKKS